MAVLMVRCHGMWHVKCSIRVYGEHEPKTEQRTENRKIALKSLLGSGFGLVALSSVSLNASDRSHVKCLACFYWNPTLLLIIYGILCSCIFYQSISVCECVEKKACSLSCQKPITETFFWCSFLSLCLTICSLDDNLSEKFKHFFGVCECFFTPEHQGRYSV